MVADSSDFCVADIGQVIGFGVGCRMKTLEFDEVFKLTWD